MSDADLMAYYLDPLIQIIHISLSIPRYQTDQLLLANDLRVPSPKLLGIINRLEHMQLIVRTKSAIKLLVESLHLPKESPVYKAWRNQLKLQAMNRLEIVTDHKAYSFSVVFSGNEAIRKEIQGRFLNLLKGVEKLVGEGPQEDVYQMSFELFPWTKI